MKRLSVLILALALLTMAASTAQTLIGSGKTNIHNGAILELVSSKTNGMLMPQVALTSASVWLPVGGVPTNGMLVFNSNDIFANGLTGSGAYVWTDGRWLPVGLKDPCELAPPTPGTIEFTEKQIDLYGSLIAYVAPVAGASSYEWTLPTGLIGSSKTNFVTIIGWKEGTYPGGSISVRAINDCGASAAKLSSSSIVVKKFVLPQIDNSGNALIQGVSCYDVAQTEGGTACGSLSSRKPAFPSSDPSKLTRIYTLSFITNTGMSDMRVGVYDDPFGLIEFVAGDKAGALSRTETFVVKFSNDVNSKAIGSRLSAKIYAIFNDNGVDKCVELTIVVQDCICCPLSVAKLVPNVVYKGSDIYEGNFNSGVQDPATLVGFTKIANSALCVYKQDNAGGGTANWNNAVAECDALNSSSTGESGWRLPNVAELMYGIVIADPTPSNYRYWSSTKYIEKSNPTNEYRLYGALLAGTTIGFTSSSIKTSQRVRCVKTVSE
ncbi:MAG: DUF1566 domain-containing protein [Tannerellaceae bacterium]|jgi:hypothetical protein|nr:DUF1566 domain-containing protein [Tannerellaceae bacterium]